jgi:hypothetical protein
MHSQLKNKATHLFKLSLGSVTFKLIFSAFLVSKVCFYLPDARGETVQNFIDPSTLQMDMLLNARIFASEKNTSNVMKLWFAQNALIAQSSQKKFQQDLLSTVWWAVAQGNVCPDDLPTDAEGANLWLVALHNHLVANMSNRARNRRSLAPNFESFTRSKQTRTALIDSKFGIKEIESLQFVSTQCQSRSTLLGLLNAFESDRAFFDLGNKATVARALQMLLERFGVQRNSQQIPNGSSLTQSRIFDLNLFLTAEVFKKTKSKNPNETELTNNFLAAVALWQGQDWQELSSERRMFLFQKVENKFTDQDHKIEVLLSLLDQSIASKNGNEINAWLASLAKTDLDLTEEVWAHPRGLQLMELPEISGFADVSYVAFERAMSNLWKGTYSEAIKNFALSLQWADRGTQADEVKVAVRRWLSYCLATYQLDANLRQLLLFTLPREDALILQEDLAWKAALRKDLKGYDLVLSNLKLPHLRMKPLEKMRWLAQGNGSHLLNIWKKNLEADPNPTLKEFDIFSQRMEKEDAEVKVSLQPFLHEMKSILLTKMTPNGESQQNGSQQIKKQNASVKASQKLTEGLKELILRIDSMTAQISTTRNLSPKSSVFAGFVRSVPQESLLSPFAFPQTQPPNPFLPIQVTPSDFDEGAVLGWRISE